LPVSSIGSVSFLVLIASVAFVTSWGGICPNQNAAQQANAGDALDFAFVGVGFGILRLLVIELYVGAPDWRALGRSFFEAS